ncbi:hypothetical protein Hdeb2414_s0004g00124321 [Helianthus debilis subsp. tardiflorus]
MEHSNVWTYSRTCHQFSSQNDVDHEVTQLTKLKSAPHEGNLVLKVCLRSEMRTWLGDLERALGFEL